MLRARIPPLILFGLLWGAAGGLRLCVRSRERASLMRLYYGSVEEAELEFQDGLYVSSLFRNTAPSSPAAVAGVQVRASPRGLGSLARQSVSYNFYSAVAHLGLAMQQLEDMRGDVARLQAEKDASLAAAEAARAMAKESERRRREAEEQLRLVPHAPEEGLAPEPAPKNMSVLLRRLQRERHRNQGLALQLKGSHLREQRLQERILESNAERELERERRASLRLRQELRIAEIRVSAAESRTLEVEGQLARLQKELAALKRARGDDDDTVDTKPAVRTSPRKHALDHRKPAAEHRKPAVEHRKLTVEHRKPAVEDGRQLVVEESVYWMRLRDTDVRSRPFNQLYGGVVLSLRQMIEGLAFALSSFHPANGAVFRASTR